jgi:serine O-acetyltransferase
MTSIQSKADYHEFLRADMFNSNVEHWTIGEYLKNDVMRYQRILRKLEYYLNCRSGIWARLVRCYLRWRRIRLGAKLGIVISPNCFGPGLSIAHPGMLVINDQVTVGKNCRIHAGVNIGTLYGAAPKIGDNVYIGPGAKIFGGITIADNSAIGANAVVCKDVPAHVTVAGVPAQVVSQKGSVDLIPALIKSDKSSR